MGQRVSLNLNYKQILTAIAGQHQPDAAFLYAYGVAQGGVFDDGEAALTLDWTPERLEQAKYHLLACGAASLSPPLIKADCTPQEMAQARRQDPAFAGLCGYYESMKGAILRRSELEMLLSVYQQLELPAEVLMLLISYCKSRDRLTPREFEKLACEWHDQGILTYDGAERHLSELKERRRRVNQVMRMFGVYDRKASPGEEKYILSWAEKGIDDELLQLAYDRTVLRTGKLQWGYLNKILADWEAQGLKTVAEIEQKDDFGKTGTAASAAPKSLEGRLRQAFEEKRRYREEELARRLAQVRRTSAPFLENEKKLKACSSRTARAAIGGDALALSRLQAESEALSLERTEILLSLGLPADYLSEEPDCPLCGDLGYIGSEMCQCFKQALREAQEKQAVPAGR